jgi:WD40 repeat protein
MASAQTFGRNKVEYESFSFSVLRTSHFQIYHYPEGAPAILDAARMLRRAYDSHEGVLGFGIRGRQKVIVYDSTVAFQQSNAISGLIPEGVGGVTESLADRIVLPLTGVNRDDNHVLSHELVHAFQQQPLGGPLGTSASLSSLPLWFVEGMAEYMSRGGQDPLTEMWMRDAVLNDQVPSITQLSSDPAKYFPYRFGESVWDYVADSYGISAVGSFFEAVAQQGVAAGIDSAFGLTTDQLSAGWNEWLKVRYGAGLSGRSAPSAVGRTLSKIGSEMNLGPVISPDGKYLAVFAQRDPFTLDLYLAEADSGKVLRRLASSNTDAHFDALNFVNSAGAWSPDGRTFAFVVFREGDNAVALVDVASGRVGRVIALEGLQGLSTLSWSPDGKRLALSATRDAVRDLYLLDLDSGKTEQLTADRYTEIDPAWSPDGTQIAFATDRGELTDLQQLVFGSMNIAVMNLADRSTQSGSLGEGVIHHNPQYSPDGGSLYFVANPEGYPDIYRYELKTGALFRLTDLATGVSGLTELSPCLSVARRSGDLVFNVFNRRGYELHLLPETAGESYVPAEPSRPTFLLKGAAAPELGAYSLAPYRPVFELVSVGQASVGLSVDTFGVGLGAAVDLLFQDILGNHDLEVAAQLNGPIQTLGGYLAYTNSVHRLNWGAQAAHIPVIDSYLLPDSEIPAEIASAGADAAVVNQLIFNDLVGLSASYPFSTERRLEGSLGYTRIAYQSTAQVDYYQGGQLFSQGSLQVSALSALNLLQGGLAYVGDYSFSGFTGPLKGRRYRFELQQTVGSLLYLTAFADYSLYLYLRPVALAFRGLHLGRYLNDAESSRLSEYYLGSPYLVRGYEYYSFSPSECAGIPAGQLCPQIARLFGSRIAVFNTELRVPVLGTAELGLIDFPYVPLTLAAFFDAGVAWTSEQPPVFELAFDSTQRIPVFSTGLAARLNLLGVLVLELYYAYPFQRPGSTGSFGLVVGSGW